MPRSGVPGNTIGGDLIWWRESTACHTLVTLWREIEALDAIGQGATVDPVVLVRLHDTSGRIVATWTQPFAKGRPLVVDSRDHPGLLEDGVLAIFVTGDTPGQIEHRRLLSMVDWYSSDGDLVSLHSDHSLTTGTGPIEYTEVVILETAEARNLLVLVNGPDAQQVGSVRLTVRNHRGEQRRAVYEARMQPFSLHTLNLGTLFPALDGFCDGRHATLEGTFDAKGVFSRPYVITVGGRFAGYHGGDRYRWGGLPRFLYKALGRGEVNPMVALHSDELTTAVNLLNSHGDLDQSFWVDARLYDEAGRQVAHRKRWLLAERGGLARGEVADLLDGRDRFAGHIALSFSDDDQPFYPRRLQALLEYRTRVSTARVMAWSDIWNARPTLRRVRDQLAGVFDVSTLYGDDCLGASDAVYRCHYRVWCRPPIVSNIAVTNSGVSEPYDATIAYVVRLSNSRGESIQARRTLGPQATDYMPIDRLFPSAEEFLAPEGIGVASVESTADLAVMHLSHHRVSGVFSAEHFLPSSSEWGGRNYTCCGS